MPAHAICPGIRRDKRRALKKDLDRIMFAPASYDWQKISEKRESFFFESNEMKKKSLVLRRTNGRSEGLITTNYLIYYCTDKTQR